MPINHFLWSFDDHWKVASLDVTTLSPASFVLERYWNKKKTSMTILNYLRIKYGRKVNNLREYNEENCGYKGIKLIEGYSNA